jgi:integrase/recombinase XerC
VALYRDAAGRQHKVAARTIAEAKAARAEHLADVRRGEHRDTSRVTFREYVCGWIQTFQGRTRSGIRPESRANYAKALGVTVEGEPILRDGRPVGALAWFGRARLAEIAPRHIREFMADLQARGLSPNSVRLHIAALRVLFATAFEDGDVRANPCAGVRVPVVQQQPSEGDDVKALTDADLAALVAATPAQHRTLVILLAETGLRISEALELRWADIDLGAQRITVSRRLYRGQVAPPKSKYGRRGVPLSDHVARDLWKLRGAAADSALVFPNRDGGHVDPSNVHRWFKPAARQAGVGWAGLHTLRHTCATNLFRAGFNAKQAQIWLGHHSPAFTLAVYTHLLSDDLPASPFAPIEMSQEGNRRVAGAAEIDGDAATA